MRTTGTLTGGVKIFLQLKIGIRLFPRDVVVQDLQGKSPKLPVVYKKEGGRITGTQSQKYSRLEHHPSTRRSSESILEYTHTHTRIVPGQLTDQPIHVAPIQIGQLKIGTVRTNVGNVAMPML
jgi:hypothetical protein